MTDLRPLPLTAFTDHQNEPELRDLEALSECGLAVAPALVVPGSVERQFYRLNNLDVRIESLFDGIDLDDPDDDDIEELAPAAGRLIAAHYLLDEFIDLFYELTAPLPQRVRVRRPGKDGYVAARGRPSLLALKRCWSDDWGFEGLWRRLSEGGPLLPAGRPTLVQPAAMERSARQVELDASALLGHAIMVFGDNELGITALREPTG